MEISDLFPSISPQSKTACWNRHIHKDECPAAPESFIFSHFPGCYRQEMSDLCAESICIIWFLYSYIDSIILNSNLGDIPAPEHAQGRRHKVTNHSQPSRRPDYLVCVNQTDFVFLSSVSFSFIGAVMSPASRPGQWTRTQHMNLISIFSSDPGDDVEQEELHRVPLRQFNAGT